LKQIYRRQLAHTLSPEKMEAIPPADLHLLHSVRTGDTAGLERLYHELFPMIRQLVAQQHGSVDDARDVFQDAILVVYEKTKNPAFQLTSRFSTWFYGICQNLWRNRIRNSASGHVTIDEAATYMQEAMTESELLQAERGRVLNRAMQKLGDDCRRLLQLYFEKITMEQIAVEMGYASDNYARRRKFQCKERLEEFIKADPAYRELKIRP
jgi:RNA polymerase sigma factor (sigma-70 family)